MVPIKTKTSYSNLEGLGEEQQLLRQQQQRPRNRVLWISVAVTTFLVVFNWIFPFVTNLCLEMGGCQSSLIPAVRGLDLERFMGDWWVIANIPLPPEKPAHNALEQYKLVGPNEVQVTFTFNDGSFTGAKKTFLSKGFVNPEEPSRWGIQFVWPIKAEYAISYVDPDYQTTIIARSRRDYVWIMARKKSLDEAAYANLVARLQIVVEKWHQNV